MLHLQWFSSGKKVYKIQSKIIFQDYILIQSVPHHTTSIGIYIESEREDTNRFYFFVGDGEYLLYDGFGSSKVYDLLLCTDLMYAIHKFLYHKTFFFDFFFLGWTLAFSLSKIKNKKRKILGISSQKRGEVVRFHELANQILKY